VRAQVNGLDAYVGTYQGQLQGLGNVAALAAAPTARISLRRQRPAAGPGNRVPERHVEKSPELAFAEPFYDSVRIGSYAIDLHPTTAGDNYFDVDARPFQIPLGALLPQRLENCCRPARTSAAPTSPMAVTGRINTASSMPQSLMT
jgi:hypothetical protein